VHAKPRQLSNLNSSCLPSLRVVPLSQDLSPHPLSKKLLYRLIEFDELAIIDFQIRPPKAPHAQYRQRDRL